VFRATAFRTGLAKAVAIAALAGSGIVSGQSATGQEIRQEQQSQADELVAQLGTGFSSGHAKVNGTSLYYVRGGSGPAVILIHGFPQDWYEFHRVMPLLAKRFTVVAADLRGVGLSDATPGGYDAANLAEDIRQLSAQLRLDRPYVVGHDIGGSVAYAFARSYPDFARGVMIIDTPLAGIGPWQEIMADPLVWHIHFHQVPGLAEKLVAGRQAIYFRYFLNRATFSDAEVAHYSASYGDADHLRAAFEFYRAFPANGEFNQAHNSPLDLPLVFATGELSPFTKFVPRIAEAMREHGCKNVKTDVVPSSWHYVANEQPEAVAAMIERYAQ
jgi:pimeloyl-ACP methyl ester carboxylesterase